MSLGREPKVHSPQRKIQRGSQVKLGSPTGKRKINVGSPNAKRNVKQYSLKSKHVKRHANGLQQLVSRTHGAVAGVAEHVYTRWKECCARRQGHVSLASRLARSRFNARLSRPRRTPKRKTKQSSTSQRQQVKGKHKADALERLVDIAPVVPAADETTELLPAGWNETSEGLEAVLRARIRAAEGNHSMTGYCHRVCAPDVSISSYIERIHTNFMSSNEIWVLALVYIDRMAKADPSLVVCEQNVRCLLLSCALVAAKFNEDDHESNDFYAKVGGVSLEDLNWLEGKVLKSLDYKLTVDRTEYSLYYNMLCAAIAQA